MHLVVLAILVMRHLPNARPQQPWTDESLAAQSGQPVEDFARAQRLLDEVAADVGVPSRLGARWVGAVAPLPTSFDRPDLETAGFVGWRKWDELRSSNLREVPSAPAVYVVFRPTAEAPIFLDTNPGGRFKEQDPTVPIEVLSANWVPSSQVVYIGKANIADRRLRQFARFGAGEKIGHWGGRYIWQLLDSDQLLVAWHIVSWTEPARDYEKRLLAHFAGLHGGARPFANLTG